MALPDDRFVYQHSERCIAILSLRKEQEHDGCMP